VGPEHDDSGVMAALVVRLLSPPDGSLSKAFAVGSVAVDICCTRLALILTTHGVRRGSEALDGELTPAARCFTVLDT